MDGVRTAGLTSQVNNKALADLAAAVAAGKDGDLGTTVYLLASMFNHSCSPNVEPTFPTNNSESSPPLFYCIPADLSPQYQATVLQHPPYPVISSVPIYRVVQVLLGSAASLSYRLKGSCDAASVMLLTLLLKPSDGHWQN